MQAFGDWRFEVGVCVDNHAGGAIERLRFFAATNSGSIRSSVCCISASLCFSEVLDPTGACSISFCSAVAYVVCIAISLGLLLHCTFHLL